MENETNTSKYDKLLDSFASLTDGITDQTLLFLLAICVLLVFAVIWLVSWPPKPDSGERRTSEPFILVVIIIVAVFLGLVVILGSDRKLTTVADCETIIPAGEFSRGTNVAVGEEPIYGHDVLLNKKPWLSVPNAAAYKVQSDSRARYTLAIEFAADPGHKRPIDVAINGVTVIRNALNFPTTGWTPEDQEWHDVGEIVLNEGSNEIELKRADVFPHIRALKLTNLSERCAP